MTGGSLPQIVVLMATFNGAAFIEDQVRSIFGQRDVRVRLVIRDDGSTDGTIDLINGLIASHPGLIEVVTDGIGPCGSAAANFCVLIRSCRTKPGEWVALSDQDDIWLPDKLSRAIEQMRVSDADGYSSNLIAFSDEGRAAWLIKKDAMTQRFDYLFQGASAGCTYVISGRALEVIRSGVSRAGHRLPQSASHDWLIYALCRSAGLRWVFDSCARIAYRQHPTNVYGSQPGLVRVLERLRLLKSRWYRKTVLWLCSTLELTDDEQQVFTRVQRLSWLDRLWLTRRAGSFRRNRRDVLQLRLALLTGLF